MKKEKNLMDKPIDIIKIFSLIYHNQKFIVNTTILFFVIGIIYSLTLQNIYKSSSTFYPHYENENQVGGGFSFNQILINEEFAHEYHGGTKKPFNI